jgi:hypothetical protein
MRFCSGFLKIIYMKHLFKNSFVLFFVFLSANLFGDFNTYTYPTNAGQAVLSDKYKVFVTVGNNPEVELQVLMSHAIGEGDWMSSEIIGRTFSFVNVSYKNTGEKLSFRVVKNFGNKVTTATLSPKSYGITPTLSGSGKEIVFDVDTTSRFLSVDFIHFDNRTSSGKRIKHMLNINIDPIEEAIPDTLASNVVVYSENLSSALLNAAKTIYFRPGYYNLKNYKNGGLIAADGTLTLQNGKQIYIAGGAFVEGLIKRSDYSNSGQKIFGRGIISGRQYMWSGHPSWNNTMPNYMQIIEIGTNAVIEGIMVMESPMHGIVGRKVTVSNLKFLGWHSNNDGVRIGEGSEVKNCFMRCVDDHFYNFDIWVHDCVLWAGHNGAILTYGWGGDGGNTYNAGSSLLENIDIIHPEWENLGNNNGLVMSQVGVDFRPFGYGGSTTTILRNIRVEGSIPGITNLKPRSDWQHNNWPVKVDINKVGYLGDLILENITINAQFTKGLIRGIKNASTTGNATFFAKNIQINNVTIGGKKVTTANVNTYFNIDTATVLDLTIDGELYGNSQTIIKTTGDSIFVQSEAYLSMEGIQTEATSDAGGGQNIGFINNGNWATYQINVEKEGNYLLTFRAASGGSGGNVEVYVDNVLKQVVPVSNSSGWQTWYTSAPVEINLTKGLRNIKTVFTGEGTGFLFNLNWMKFSLIASNTAINSARNEMAFTIYPNPASGWFTINNPEAKTMHLSIYNASGQLIMTKDLDGQRQHKIDGSAFKKGIYLARVSTNGSTRTVKIIIE